MKKRNLILGVLALTLLFGVARKAEAQIRNTAQRDKTLLDAFASLPYYYVGGGDQANGMAQSVIGVLAPTEVDGAHYAISGGNLFIAFASANGGRMVIIGFSDSKETVEKGKAASEAKGFTCYGPFESGSTDASRKAALQRIVAAVKAYIANPDSIPQKW
jgi:hypothetical protein